MNLNLHGARNFTTKIMPASTVEQDLSRIYKGVVGVLGYLLRDFGCGWVCVDVEGQNAEVSGAT